MGRISRNRLSRGCYHVYNRGLNATRGLQREEDRLGNRTDFDYDKAGQLVNVKRSGTLVSGNAYDKGLLKEQTNASGAKTRMNYDAMGRLVEKLIPGGKSELKYD